MRVVLAAVVLLACAQAALVAAETAPTPEAVMLTELNAYRAEHGRAPLLRDPSLEAAAEWKAWDMGLNNYFGHNDQDGRDLGTRLCDFGYCWPVWRGENIAAGFGTSADAMLGWQGSPGHDANLLREEFKVAGMGYAEVEGSTYYRYYVQDFGGWVAVTPTPAPTPTAISATPAPCDLNGDGAVTITDVLSLKPYMGTASAAHDLNGDGIVNISDVLFWRMCLEGDTE